MKAGAVTPKPLGTSFQKDKLTRKANHRVSSVTRPNLSLVLSLPPRTGLMEMCEPINTCVVCGILSPGFWEAAVDRKAREGMRVGKTSRVNLFPLVYTHTHTHMLSLSPHSPLSRLIKAWRTHMRELKVWSPKWVQKWEQSKCLSGERGPGAQQLRQIFTVFRVSLRDFHQAGQLRAS